MSNVVDLEARRSSHQHAQAEAEIVAIQARVTMAILDSDDPHMAVYALLSAALCIAPPKGTPHDWRMFVEDAFAEIRSIITV